VAGEQIRLLVIEDVPQVASHMRSLLNAQTQIKMLDVVTSGERAVPSVAEMRPDIVIVDALLQGRGSGTPDHEDSGRHRRVELVGRDPLLLEHLLEHELAPTLRGFAPALVMVIVAPLAPVAPPSWTMTVTPLGLVDDPPQPEASAARDRDARIRVRLCDMTKRTSVKC
jgi:hypothetical protein